MPHFSKPYASVDPSVVPEASLGWKLENTKILTPQSYQN